MTVKGDAESLYSVGKGNHAASNADSSEWRVVTKFCRMPKMMASEPGVKCGEAGEVRLEGVSCCSKKKLSVISILLYTDVEVRGDATDRCRVEREKDGTQYRALWNSQVAGGVTRRCMAGTNRLGSASDVGFIEVEDRAGNSKSDVKSR